MKLKLTTKQTIFGVLSLGLIALIPGIAAASTTGTEFQGMYNMVVGWLNGYGGKLIAIFAFAIGLGLGAARSNPIPAIAGIVFALFAAFGPGLLDGIVTAVV